MALSVSTSPELSTLKFSDQGTLILSSSETKKGNSAINSSDVFQIFATYALSTVRVSVDPYGGFWSRTYINASPDWSGGTPLYVSAISGQTGDLTKWQNSAGTVLANVDANGKIAAPIFQSTVAGTAYIVTGSNNNAIRVQTNGTTNVGLIIRGEASQTANLQEWQNSDGTVLSKIDANGLISLPGGSWHLLGGFETWYKNSTSFYQKGASHTFRRQSDDTDLFTIGGNGNTSVLLKSASAVGLIVKSAASQTADLQQWQNSAGSVTAKVSSSGAISSSAGGFFGSTDAAASGVNYLAVRGWAADHVPFAVKGFTAQTGDLTRWINDAGTVLTSISSAGKLTSAVDASINGVTVGMGAGSASTNTVTGLNSLISNTTGTYNTAFGNQSLQLNTSGTQNTAFGQGALYNNRTGWYNTAFGQGALYNNNTAYSNTAIGANALVNNSSGSNNIAVGIQSLLGNNSGGNNIGLGSDAGYSNVTGSSNIFIGHQAGYYETGSNKLYIANSNTATPLIGGDFSAKTLTFAGNATVVSQAAATQGLIIKGAASQTANLQEWQNSSGTVMGRVDGQYGTIRSISGLDLTNTYTGAPTITARVNYPNTTPIIIVGAASQTANLQEWQRDDGFVLLKVSSAGDVTAGSGSSTAIRFRYFDGINITGTYWDTVETNSATFIGRSTTATTMVVRAATSQTADILQIQDSGGAARAIFERGGALSVQPSTALNGYTGFFKSPSSSVAGLMVRGAASQSANLQEWQNSSGTVLTKINSNGALSLSNATLVTSESSNIGDKIGLYSNAFGFGIDYGRTVAFVSAVGDAFAVRVAASSGTASFGSDAVALFGNGSVVQTLSSASTVGLIVKAAASQTADLQQWQDSAGTVLAKIMSNGSLFVNSTGTANDPITIQRASATRFKVDPYGNVFAVALTAGNVVNSIAGTTAGIYATSASTIGAVIRGAASQSANLQEWQNSSGTVLSSITNNGFLNTPAILENPTISATAATGTINYDLLTNKSVTYYTSNASANWTLNIRGNSSTTLDSLMAVGQSLTIAFLVAQGSTAYYQSGLQIDGTSVTPKWQGGVAPTFGNASGVDSYSITIMKTASATFTVFESQTRFA